MTYEEIKMKNGFIVRGFVVRETDEYVSVKETHNTWDLNKEDIDTRQVVPFR